MVPSNTSSCAASGGTGSWVPRQRCCPTVDPAKDSQTGAERILPKGHLRRDTHLDVHGSRRPVCDRALGHPGDATGSAPGSTDATVVAIARPAIGADLIASFAGLQWTVTGYPLTLAALIQWPRRRSSRRRSVPRTEAGGRVGVRNDLTRVPEPHETGTAALVHVELLRPTDLLGDVERTADGGAGNQSRYLIRRHLLEVGVREMNPTPDGARATSGSSRSLLPAWRRTTAPVKPGESRAYLRLDPHSIAWSTRRAGIL